MLRFTLAPRRVLKYLLALCLVLFGIHVTMYLAADAASRSCCGGSVTGALNLGTDSAIPTWFASAILALGAICAFLIARIEAAKPDGDSLYWKGIGAVFVLFSIDEVATLHERWGDITDKWVDSDNDFLHYGWVISGLIFVAVFVVLYLPFLIRLDKTTRNRLILAGFVFVSGALITEMWNASLDAQGDESTLRYALQTGVEELLEFVGASLFLYTLLARLDDEQAALSIAFEGSITNDAVSTSEPVT